MGHSQNYSSSLRPVAGQIKGGNGIMETRLHLDQHWISRPVIPAVLLIKLTASPISSWNIARAVSIRLKGVENRAGRQEREWRRGGQRQEIPVQHELFSSIVPPEQLFVPVPPSPSIRPLTTIHCSSVRQPHHYHHCRHRHRGKNNPNLCHTHTHTHTHTYACTQFTCGPLLSSAGVVERGSKSLGFPSISVQSPAAVRA